MKKIIEKIREYIKSNLGLAIAAVIIFVVVVAGGGYAGYRIYEDKISEDTLLVDITENTNDLEKNEADTTQIEKSDTSEKQDKDAVKTDDKTDKEDAEVTTEDKKTDKVTKNDKLVKEDKNAKTDSKKADSAKKETTTTSNTTSSNSNSSTSSNSSNTVNNSGSSGSTNSSSSNKSNGSSSSSSSSGNSSGGTTSKTETTCSHNWVWKTKTVHHDAVTHKEEYWSDPIEQPIQETRIQCGSCDRYYVSYDDFYANDTCHSSWSEVTITTGWYTEPGHLIDTVTVVDQEAYDEEVNDYQYCSKCGARK